MAIPLLAGLCQPAPGAFNANAFATEPVRDLRSYGDLPTLEELQERAWRQFEIAVVVGEVPFSLCVPAIEHYPSVLIAPSVEEALLWLAGVRS